jgi:hypothetical protein
MIFGEVSEEPVVRPSERTISKYKPPYQDQISSS